MTTGSEGSTGSQGNPSIQGEERHEALRHDTIYGRQAPSRLLLTDDAWQRFNSPGAPLSSYMASVWRLGDVHGRTVLDAGCGDGWLSVILAKLGAEVVGFDISAQAAHVARERARANRVSEACWFTTASWYNMPFRDGAFDLVIGQAVLHHLQHKPEASAELARIMAPGGRAIFSEPFGNVLWLERLRLVVPVPSEATDDPGEWKRQLKYADLGPFRAYFEVAIEEFQLFSRLDRVLPKGRLVVALNKFDRWLLRLLPVLRPFARTVLVELRRPQKL